jgi:diguanylate cyclase (GGDEF)-like protein
MVTNNERLQQMPETSAPDTQDPAEEALPSEVPPRRDSDSSMGKVYGVIAGMVASPIIFCLLLLLPHELAWLAQLILSLAAGYLAYFLISTRGKRLATPLHELAGAIREVREGRQPIESLSQFPPTVELIAGEVQLALRELRKQKQALAELNEEVRGKVANRTIALERKLESLKNQATRDGLTGLYNRRMLDQILPQVINQSVNDRIELSVLMIDVDYFKDLNDTLGHHAGDEMLKSIAQVIGSTIRDGDLGFRCGGDEFVVLLPGCAKECAGAIATRLRSLVRGLGSTLKVERKPQLSIGVCALSDVEDKSAASLLRRADELLYACKASRRTAPKATASPAA